MDFFIWSTIILAIWGALGPLVGVRYGQELSSRFQRSQWIAENRKQECRELLAAMTAHCAAIGIASGRATPADHQRRDSLEVALISLFDDRIFISEDIAKLDLRQRWFAGPGSIHRNYGSSEEYLEARDKLLNTVRGLARRAK